MMDAQTLIILTPGFPKDEEDSVCLPTQQLFVRTVHRLFPELDIQVVALHYPYHNEVYKWNGVNVYPLDGKSKKGLLRPLIWYRCYKLLSELTKTKKCIGILSFWCNETALIGNYFSKRKKINHKIWISGQDARKENVFVKWIKPRPADLIAMSDFLKTEFHKNHNIEAQHVIYNGVEFTYTNVPRSIDIIGTGSLTKLKQYNILVEIVAELKKQNANISAVIVGKGPEENNLRNMIRHLGVEENIKMVGELDHATLMTWMNRAKVLVHPSRYEGYSTVCLEALANGCHVVSFTHAENNQVKNWHIVTDQKEMVSKVSQLLKPDIMPSPLFHRDIETTAKQMVSLFRL